MWHGKHHIYILEDLRINTCTSGVMDLDTKSTTSVDDKTEYFCENPTRDTLAEGLMRLLKPTIGQLLERVRATR
jgi:hypothetical protein